MSSLMIPPPNVKIFLDTYLTNPLDKSCLLVEDKIISLHPNGPMRKKSPKVSAKIFMRFF